MKKNKISKNVGDVIEEAVQNVIKRIIDLNSEEGVSGREEEFTSQIKSEISIHLLSEIRRLLDGKEINNVKFKVYTYKKRDESKIGADFSGFLEINKGDRSVTKAFLAQAKVCHVENPSTPNMKIKGYDKNLSGQINNMLRITSDSFLFLYTKNGVYVTPAFEVQLNGNSIDSDYFYYRSIGGFYQEFFKCFIGDHKLAEAYNLPKNLAQFSEDHDVNNILYIRAKIL